ncbi:hypothetical protein EDM55_13040 [Brevibacillus centrosporus]|nr:hypothetical protein EDM55_13040 [Brevibacillus centrosporus]
MKSEISLRGSFFHAPHKIGLPHAKILSYCLFIEMGKHIEIQSIPRGRSVIQNKHPIILKRALDKIQ